MEPYETKPVKIEVAYHELTKQAFSAWIRLMIVPEKELVGRAKIAKILEYATSNSNVILRELKWKKYIDWIPANRPSLKGKLLLLKRALISGPTHFIRLSHFL